MTQHKQSTLTRELSRNIDAAYEAYKAKAPDAEKRLLGAFLEQARNIARFRLKELYDGTVAYDAAHGCGAQKFHFCSHLTSVLTFSSLASPAPKTAKATENSSQSNWPCAILTPHVTLLPQRGSLMHFVL
jgi:hypothetical protein